ncbi:P-loop containing nucleoside triphosphate hydrolase protein [Syncephalis fuscata]|nr:P-loop containing nucleoside triphosphate hydrolase protein [Syncephalis fuscata]
MTFWKPGTIAPGIDVDREQVWETDAAQDAALITSHHTHYEALSMAQQRASLPIYKHRKELLWLVEKHRTTVLVGQTGSGKTTQMPQYLYEAGWADGGRVIACTQPRRIAATSVAERVAEEMRVNIGQEVAYSVRFDDCYDADRTRIRYMTDGTLFREAMQDPLLSKYSVIMVDEAHERSLYTDMLLGLLKRIQRQRSDLRVIISSATMDAEAFVNFFNTNQTGDANDNDAVAISLEGRMHPVDVQYLEQPCENYLDEAVRTVMAIHTNELPGDILVFLTGRDEVDHVVARITQLTAGIPRGDLRLDAMAIYAGLPLDRQMAVFESAGYNTRKVIVATNVAEASLTIDGIVYVVDSGFVKIKAYNSATGMDRLVITPVSQASAQQRAGRAGRVRPGKAFRLYTEATFNGLSVNSVPEMQRTDLSSVILQLKAMGIDNVLRFDYMTPPPTQLMVRALELLYSLKTLDDHARLTIPLGTQMAECPLDPMLSKILLDAHSFKCGEEMLTIAAMASVQNVFTTPSKRSTLELEEERRKFAVEEGDHITLLNVYNAFIQKGSNSQWCSRHCLNYRVLQRAVTIRKQLRGYLTRFKLPIASCQGDTTAIRKCLTSGYFAHAARMQPDGSLRTLRDNATLYLHPTSVLFKRSPKFVIYHEVIETTKPFARQVSTIDVAWLTELAPHFYETKPVVRRGR